MTDVAVSNETPPLSVIAYGPAHVIWNLLFVFARKERFDLGFFGPLLIPLAVAFGIWRHAKAAWVVGIVLAGLAILLGIGHIVQDQVMLGALQVGGALVMLGFLLSPPTRRWVT